MVKTTTVKSTTKKSLEKGSTVKASAGEAQPTAKDLAAMQKRIASAVHVGVRKTKHGYGKPWTTVKIGISSKALALSALAANQPGGTLKKLTEKSYLFEGTEKEVHKALGLDAGPIFCTNLFTGSMYVRANEFPAWTQHPPVRVFEAKLSFRGDNEMTFKLHSKLSGTKADFGYK